MTVFWGVLIAFIAARAVCLNARRVQKGRCRLQTATVDAEEHQLFEEYAESSHTKFYTIN